MVVSMEEYLLTVTTSDRYATAGTGATVHAKITGTEGGSTNWVKLDYFFNNDFKKGLTECYTIQHKEDEEVGQPLLLHLKLKGLTRLDTWFCDEVMVEYNNDIFLFPVYEWIEAEEVAVMRGDAFLPQQLSTPALKVHREKEMFERRNKYKWEKKPKTNQKLSWGICRYVSEDVSKKVPTLFRKPTGRVKKKGRWTLKTSLTIASNLFQGLFTKLQVPDDYKKLYRHIGTSEPLFINDWNKDEEFGRQTLNGISPLAFERCTKLPDYCNVSTDDVIELLSEGSTLESEIDEGRIFIVDYTLAETVERNSNPETGMSYVHADCIGLFRVNDEGRFLPIAIQLVPNSREHIFTPTDDDYDWLLAKLYFNNTAQAFQHWIYRYLHTHAVPETFSVGTMRNLPRNHPIYKLLKPHLRTVVDVNREMREHVIPSDSKISKSTSLEIAGFLRKAYKKFNLADLDIPQLLKTKGLMDRDLLPGYHYRDDALLLWGAIHTYVADVLSIFYLFDKDVRDDFELQSWAQDLAYEGFGWQDGDTRGMPERILTLTELVHLCTTIIFASSAQHAAVNFGQMESYKFVPNSPSAMLLPVHKKGEANLKRVMASLPDVKTSTLMISYYYALSSYVKDEAYLGDVTERLFTEEDVIKKQRKFKYRLEHLSVKINKRNRRRSYPYYYLLPENIPIGVSV